MALLSVIVPVYRVEEYLAECLDSILGQSFGDVEVVAVDDASDDGCAEILAGHAAREPRLKVVTLSRNSGLGAARNAGLAAATGRYVWFVDSDDWLPEGTLEAVAARLADTEPDLLVVGYARVYPDGTRRYESLAKVTGGRPMPDTFTLAGQPSMLNVLHIACNKIVRRDFLAETGIGFGPGWYEDVSFSLPLMLAADRIALLDRDCYAYRQRQAGAITQTVSDRHFEVFPHWERVFAFMDEHPAETGSVRPLIFQRMIWHYLSVLGHSHRVPKMRRKEFFTRMAQHYRRYLPPAGYPMPGGAAGLKHRLVGRGAYRLFEALRAVKKGRLDTATRTSQPRAATPELTDGRGLAR
ncbi:glycosyltransferase family 2 protein [Polymorphospora sp. NPDC050346]|uniref:glycosyltransferase family 2 protein n=1 Tax=Polymorphospora sp. NPDC050346 TaxID=3155780 RepID=UPI0033E189E6